MFVRSVERKAEESIKRQRSHCKEMIAECSQSIEMKVMSD